MFDCQVKPVQLYALEIWGTMNIHAHLFTCKILLNVNYPPPPPLPTNNMIFGEKDVYPILIDSLTKSLRYWLKTTNMLLNLFQRQAYTMLRNAVETANQNNQ